MKNLSEEHEDKLLAIIQRYWNGTQTPTQNGTNQSSIGSTKEKEKVAIRTTTEA
jgi:hypothetical protein